MHKIRTNGMLKALALLTTLLATPTMAAEAIYTFAVVPQESAVKTAETWAPLVTYLNRTSGHRFRLKITQNIPLFENKLGSGSYDFAYMNPYHYVVYHERAGYQALARAREKRIQGLLVVHRDSKIQTLEDLADQAVAFPSPAAFAASVLPRAELKRRNIPIRTDYVSSHDAVYLDVAAQRYVAGGGVGRTLKNSARETQDKLRILWKSEEFTPHAIATHPRVPADVAQAMLNALLALNTDPKGPEILQRINIPGFEPGADADWDDIRALHIEEL